LRSYYFDARGNRQDEPPAVLDRWGHATPVRALAFDDADPFRAIVASPQNKELHAKDPAAFTDNADFNRRVRTLRAMTRQSDLAAGTLRLESQRPPEDFDAREIGFVTPVRERFEHLTPEKAAQELGVSAERLRHYAAAIREPGLLTDRASFDQRFCQLKERLADRPSLASGTDLAQPPAGHY
jgi:hypothetical protein